MKLHIVILMFLLTFTLAVNAQNLELSDQPISLNGKSVNQVYKSKGKPDPSEDYSEPSVQVLAGGSSSGSTSVTVPLRGPWYIGIVSMNSSIPILSSYISGVDFTANFFGGSTVDRNKTLVYLCRHNGLDCHQITGMGSGSTGVWNNSPVWRGFSHLSPNWEYWIGVVREEGESEIMSSPISFIGSVTMDWTD